MDPIIYYCVGARPVHRMQLKGRCTLSCGRRCFKREIPVYRNVSMVIVMCACFFISPFAVALHTKSNWMVQLGKHFSGDCESAPLHDKNT